MPASTAEINTNLDARFGSGTPTTWYAAILTTLPTDDAGNGSNEPSDAAYARVALTNNTSNFPSASGGAQSVSAEVEFPQVSSGETWTGVGVAFFTASTGGNPAYWLAKTVTATAGQVIRFNSGDIEITD